MCTSSYCEKNLVGLISCQQEDLNIQAISAIREIGLGCATIETFCGLMNML